MGSSIFRRVDHVAIGTVVKAPARDLFFNLFGGTIHWDDTTERPNGFRGSVVEWDGTRLELLEPTTPDSFLHRFLADRGPGLHHINVNCDYPDQLVERLEKEGRRLTGVVRRNGHVVNGFIFPKSSHGVVVQLHPRPDWYPADEASRDYHEGIPMPFRPPAPVLGKIDRVVVGVREVEPALEFFRSMFGGEVEENPPDALAGTCEKILRWEGISMGFAETIGDQSPLPSFLERVGEGMHHLVYRCAEVERTVEVARQSKCQISEVGLAGGSKTTMVGPANTFGARLLLVASGS